MTEAEPGSRSSRRPDPEDPSTPAGGPAPSAGSPRAADSAADSAAEPAARTRPERDPESESVPAARTRPQPEPQPQPQPAERRPPRVDPPCGVQDPPPDHTLAADPATDPGGEPASEHAPLTEPAPDPVPAVVPPDRRATPPDRPADHPTSPTPDHAPSPTPEAGPSREPDGEPAPVHEPAGEGPPTLAARDRSGGGDGTAGDVPGAAPGPVPARRWWAGATVTGIHLAAALLVTAALGWTLWNGFRQPLVALAFGLFVALGVALHVPLPGDREATPLGFAGGLGYALLGEVGGVPADHGPLQVVAVAGCGFLLGFAPRVARGRAPDVDRVARRMLTLGWVAGCFQVLRAGSPDGLTTGGDQPAAPWSYPLALVVLLVLGALGDALLAAVLTAARTGRRHPAVLAQELRAMAGIGTAIAATGTVIALAVATAGLWALPVCAVPLLLAQLSFRRYAEVRATYRQTIASLARATEVAGHTPPGHARRVADLSRAVGRELGLAEPDLTVLEYAALMHDIGQLSLLDPLAEGATEPLPPDQRRQIALLGGAVVRQTGVSPQVAVVVERQADPYREQPLTARVVRTVNAFVEGTPEGDAAAAQRALSTLRRCTARDFDPQVVEAVAKVASRGRPV